MRSCSRVDVEDAAPVSIALGLAELLLVHAREAGEQIDLPRRILRLLSSLS